MLGWSQFHRIDEESGVAHQLSELSCAPERMTALADLTAMLLKHFLPGAEWTATRHGVLLRPAEAQPRMVAVVFVDHASELSSGLGMRTEDPVGLGLELTHLAPFERHLVRQYLRKNFADRYLDPERCSHKLRLRPGSRERAFDVVFFEDGPPCSDFDERLRDMVRQAVRVPPPPRACRLSAFMPRCSNRLFKPDSLSPPGIPAPHGARIEAHRARFELGGLRLDAASNVYYVPRAALLEIEALRWIRAAPYELSSLLARFMYHYVDHFDEEAGRELYPELAALAGAAKYVVRAPRPARRGQGSLLEIPAAPVGDQADDQVVQVAKLLSQWDDVTDLVLAKVKASAAATLSVHRFTRTGCCLPGAVQLGAHVYPAGCYVDDALPESERRRVTVRELARAALAQNRTARALRGCRWLEQGFADLLCRRWLTAESQGALPGPVDLSNMGPDAELDVNRSFEYLELLTEQQAEELLHAYLDDAKPCAFCGVVKKLRRAILVASERSPASPTR